MTIGSMVIASPTVTTTYTIIGIDSLGCSDSANPDLNVSIDEAADTLADTATPEQTLLWEESIGEIRTALREMPQELRDVFLLSRFRRKTYPEIAHMLGISSRTVERRMSQAMTLLAARLRGAP
jgi:RNA polymerase sigma factor (sigma-70 family)